MRFPYCAGWPTQLGSPNAARRTGVANLAAGPVMAGTEGAACVEERAPVHLEESATAPGKMAFTLWRPLQSDAGFER